MTRVEKINKAVLEFHTPDGDTLSIILHDKNTVFTIDNFEYPLSAVIDNDALPKLIEFLQQQLPRE